MKKLWRRVLLLTALLVAAMTIYASAQTTQYVASKFEFTKKTTMSSKSFYVGTRTNFTVHIKLYNNYSVLTPQILYTINSGTDLVLQNVSTGQTLYLTDKDYYSQEYDVHITADPGTYQFQVRNRQNYWFVLDYRVVGSGGGIDVDDKLELTVGESKTLKITDMYGNPIVVSRTEEANFSPDPGAAVVSNINTQVYPNEVTFRGRFVGTTYIDVYGYDGSSDQVMVTVTDSQKTPTLLYSKLNLSVDEMVYNDVLNTYSEITWSSSDRSVATVDGNGKIVATGAGSAKITALVVDTGQRLTCSVKVSGQEISFMAYIRSFKPGSRQVKIKIVNYCDDDMVIYNSGAQLQLIPDSGGSSAQFTKLRSLKMQNASKITVPEGRSKSITFTIKGSKVTGLTKNEVAVRVKFKLDGVTYYARCFAGKYYGQYCLSGSNNWMYSYLNED